MHSFKTGDEVRVNNLESSLYDQRGTITYVGRYYAGVSFRPGGRELVSLDHLTLITAKAAPKVDREAILRSNAHLGLIDQIREFRSATGEGLKESKDAVEAFRARAKSPVGKHWLIAVIDKGDLKPRPNSPPRLYTSAEQARAVAYSMAEKNRTETFVVYEATDVIVAPPVSLPLTQHHKL